MDCPNSEKEKPDQDDIKVRTSRLAIVALIAGLISPFALLLAVKLRIDIFVFIFLGAGVLAIIVGIVSLVQIAISGDKIVGRGFAIIGIIIPAVPYLLIFLSALLFRPRSRAFRMTCGTNLAGMGKAMLIYANDHNGKLPRAGDPGTRWTGLTDHRDGPDRHTAFGLAEDGTGGTASIYSSLYMFVKYTEVTLKAFICTDDKGVSEFKLADYPGRNPNCGETIDAWDFGPDPARHCSYSYHYPYGEHALTTNSRNDLAVAADRNPWIDSPAGRARDFRVFDPDGDRVAQNAGNAIAHESFGQNVLFVDAHVNFELRSYCGANDDNIYTYQDGQDIKRGRPPVVGSEPAGKEDSLLVNDPPVYGHK